MLFAQGGKIGPDLTTYKRDDLRGMLLNVVNPSAEIREGFENYIARTADGRTLTGFIADQDANVVVLRGADGQNISLARDDIEDLRASRTSLMPDGQLKDLTDQQIRDLFAYLRARSRCLSRLRLSGRAKERPPESAVDQACRPLAKVTQALQPAVP